MIGKDILKFHTVFWPALLMAAELELPHHVFVHGFLLAGDGRKMSKSLGNVLDPFEVLERYGADALRHYLLREVSFGQDGPVSADGFQARYDAELANEYGNLASRTLNMLERYCDGVVPGGRDRRGAARGVRGSVRPRGRAARRGRALGRARGDLAPRPQAQPLRRGEGAVGAGARIPSRADELAGVLASLAEGLRVVTRRAACPTCRSRPRRCWMRWAPAGDAAREFASQGWGGRVSALAPLFPKRPRAAGVIDSHTHLDACEPPDGELVAAAEAAGVVRMLTVGTDPDSCRAALAAAERFPSVYAAVGCHPNIAQQLDVALLRGARGRTRAASRSARRDSTITATGRRASCSCVPSRRRSSWRARSTSRS